MNFSRYIKQFSSDDPDYDLLYSIKKGAAVLLHKEAMKSVFDSSHPSSTQDTLTELGFLVQDIEQEKREMLTFLDKP